MRAISTKAGNTTWSLTFLNLSCYKQDISKTRFILLEGNLPKPSNPCFEPTNWPTDQPTVRPTVRPTDRPTDQPNDQPTDRLNYRPTNQPANWLTDWPTDRPTDWPTDRPTNCPTERPTDQPTDQSTDRSTDQPQRNKKCSQDRARGRQCPTKNLLEVWQNLAIFGGIPISGTVEALMTKVVDRWLSVLSI